MIYAVTTNHCREAKLLCADDKNALTRVVKRVFGEGINYVCDDNGRYIFYTTSYRIVARPFSR